MPHFTRAMLPRVAATTAARGWRIFPLAPGAKAPAVRSWEERASTDQQRISACWSAGTYNIGIATGPSSLVVIDLDVPKNAEDAPPADMPPGIVCGADVLALLAEQHGQLLPCETYTVRTPSGGMHLYFAAPQGIELRNTCGSLGWKIDTRAAGGYVVGSGSLVDGKAYEVLHDAVPAPLPTWLTTLLTPAPLPPQRPVTVPLPSATRHSQYLRSAVAHELKYVTRAAIGERNQQLYGASVALGQLIAGGELDRAEVADSLTGAAVNVGLTEEKARRTIASGFRAGANRPRTVSVKGTAA